MKQILLILTLLFLNQIAQAGDCITIYNNQYTICKPIEQIEYTETDRYCKRTNYRGISCKLWSNRSIISIYFPRRWTYESLMFYDRQDFLITKNKLEKWLNE